MKVITEPTVLADASDVEAIGSEPDQYRSISILQDLLNQAFDAGRSLSAPALPFVEQSKPTAPVSVDISAVTIPPLKAWELIRENAPQNPIERFQHDQTPPDSASTALWNSQLIEALKFAVKQYR